MCFISKTKGERKSFSVSFNRIYVSLSSIKLIQHRSENFLLKKLANCITGKNEMNLVLELN